MMYIRGDEMSKLLLVEDDTTLAMSIEYSLKKEGYLVDTAHNYSKAMELIDSTKYDLTILDIELPDGNGFELCKHIRKFGNTPVIFLTAKDEEVNVVMGLDIGGDDYITKPFRLKELLSRIKAVLRRTKDTTVENILISNDIKIDLLQSKVYKKDQQVYLTPSEHKLLIHLMQNSKQVLPRARILEKLWDIHGEFVDDNSLSVYIKRLREKIEDDHTKPEYIKTVRGTGYLWDKTTRGD